MSTMSRSESEVAVRILGTDPWIRFDMWSTRAWEAAQGAIALAAANGAPINPDDDLDHRIVTLFHAAAVAKEFAEMVNPLIVASGVRFNSGSDAAGDSDHSIDMLFEAEDQG